MIVSVPHKIARHFNISAFYFNMVVYSPEFSFLCCRKCDYRFIYFIQNRFYEYFACLS